MKNDNTYVIIMAGGVGSRLWPLSRKKKPKQFHDFLGLGKSLIRITYERHLDICSTENFLVVTNADYYNLVKEHLPELSDQQILLEPEGRNTAPCIAYAGYKVCQKNENASFVVCPADHLITNEAKYLDNISTALAHAKKENVLVTLGIRPTRPDTGYGYIQYEKTSPTALHRVTNFTEKPTVEKAKEFLASGDFVWNAGIFVWSGKSIDEAFKTFLPRQHQLFGSGAISYFTKSEQKGVDEAYAQAESISIDYGIMEKAPNVYTVLSEFNWSDLGTWSSVYEQSEQDENDNAKMGNILTYGVKNSLLRTTEGKLVIVQGLENMIVIDQEDVLMICSKDNDQQVKQFVADLSDNGEQYL